MAIIGKIQEKRYLLVGIVGLALLTFILTGLLSKNGDNVDRTVLGTIAGEKMDTAIYYSKVRTYVNNAQQQAQQQQREFTDKDREQAEDGAWSGAVDEIILDKEYEALGLEVSDNEFNSYLYGEDGFTLIPEIAQSFTDPATGQFNATRLDQYVQEQEKSSDAAVIERWKATKTALRNQRNQEKYFQIIGQGIYVTKLEAKNEYLANNSKKSISFFTRQYREILDTEIKVTDKDVLAFYEKHKNDKKYEVMAGRDVKYFDIQIAPSQSDSAEFNTKMAKIKSGFETSTNDSMYVLANSDTRFYVSSHQATFRPAGDAKARQGMTYPAFLDTVFKTATVGQIVGPYQDGAATRIAKILDFNTAVCKVRHILISAPKGDAKKIASSKKLADSLVKVVNKDNFEQFVTKYSEDPGSKDKGGVYEDFMDYEMVEPFSDFSVGKPIGTIGVVQTDFGFHIMEVLDRKTVKYPVLALIEKTLTPSDQTMRDLKNNAMDLLVKIDTKISKQSDEVKKLALFDTIARKEGYFSRPLRMFDEAPKVMGFNTKLAEQRILELAYGADAVVGKLCSSPIQDDKRLIIAVLSSVREKGVPAFVDKYEEMRVEVLKEKKAARFLKQMGKLTNIEALANKFKTTVMTAELVFANPSIEGGGYEPEIIGALFSNSLKDGKTSQPIVGKSGVYVIRVNKTINAPTAVNYEAERATLNGNVKNSVANEARRGLQKKADLHDNRKLVEVGIFRD